MTTLTKKQRREVFEIAISTFNIDHYAHEFLCIHLKEIINTHSDGVSKITAKDVPEILPELDLFNPKNDHVAWLCNGNYQESNNHRAIVLLFCLELVK